MIAHAGPDSLGYSVTHFRMSTYRTTAHALATAFLAGQLEADELVDRGSHLLGRRWRWIRPLARRIVASFGGKTRPRVATLTKFILADKGFSRATEKHELRLANLLGCTPTMCPNHRSKVHTSWPSAVAPCSKVRSARTASISSTSSGEVV